MGTRMMKKNILKPIQFITKIFDAKEEDELQIGLPTDVKHLAHIGFHGPDTDGPSWMDQYHSAPLTDVKGSEPLPATRWASQEINFPCHEIQESPREAAQTTQSPRHQKPRHSRRHQSEGMITAVEKDSSVTKKKGHRFRKKKEEAISSSGNPDVPAVPKSKKKKSKEGSGSSRPRRREAVVAPEEAAEEGEGEERGEVRADQVAKAKKLATEEIGALS